MSENTKFSLEYAIKQGYRVADDFAASLLLFEKRHYTNNTNWEVFIDWRNGNFQELELNNSAQNGNQWVEMTNPGSAGIYYLVLRKGSTAQYRANFTRHNGVDAPYLEWIGQQLTDKHIIDLPAGAALLITFLWDGTKYIAFVLPEIPTGKVPKHGYFYNWHAVNSQKLEIPGWRIPTQQDYSDLELALSLHNNQPGTQLKAQSPLWNGTDLHGFKSLPTGQRSVNGAFLEETISTMYWSATEYTSGSVNAYAGSLASSYTAFFVNTIYNKRQGFPIRLIRNGTQGYVSGEKVKDIDGNIYDTVHLSWVINSILYNRVWLKQNLATSRYNDGTGIPFITNDTTWANLNTAAICSYNNNLQNVFE